MMIKSYRFRMDGQIEDEGWFGAVEEKIRAIFGTDLWCLRFAITESEKSKNTCEVDVLTKLPLDGWRMSEPIFRFRRRTGGNSGQFSVAMLVPTGINLMIGGHSGDATPAAKLLGAACDHLIVHPNVVNASDINEMPSNAVYSEGSVLCRLFMGAVGLRPTQSNRVMLVIDDHVDEYFVNAAINSVNAARVTLGLRCSEIVRLSPPIRMRASYAKSGRAVGEIGNLSGIFKLCEQRRRDFDALAISSVIEVPPSYHQEYFDSKGEMVNPWGGVEAMLTHAISEGLHIPSAHSPMFESRVIANKDPGVVEPRMSAEAISLTFMQCVLKGLHKSPRIVTDAEEMKEAGVITVSDISCLVIPDGCVGLPTLAALFQGIPVIAVRENRNIMKNDLGRLPWCTGQLHVVENYWEAAGVVLAIREGIDPASVRRPVSVTKVSTFSSEPEVSDDTLVRHSVGRAACAGSVEDGG